MLKRGETMSDLQDTGGVSGEGVYRWMVGAAGLGAFAAASAAGGAWLPTDPLQWAALTLLYCGGALLEVPVGKVSLNLGYMALFAVMVNLGAVDAMWLVFAAAAVMTLRGRREVRSSLFNFGQQCLCVAVGVGVFQLLGGEIGNFSLLHHALALLFGSITFDVVNVALVAAGLVLAGEGDFATEFFELYWKRRRYTVVLYHALALVCAVLYAHEGLVAAVLLAAVILSMRSAFQLPYQLEQQREAALRDGMTEAYNYRFLTEWMSGEGAALVQQEIPFSFLFIDIDDLKSINDSQGHAAGDAVIRCVVDCLRRVCRRDDRIIRYGGDEFLAVLVGTERRGGLSVAGRLLRVLEEEVGDEIQFTLSIGVAAYPDDAESPSELFDVVDAASYRGKEDPGHSVRIPGDGAQLA